MKEFKIAQPQSLKQFISLLSEKKDGYYLMAGGTDLLDEIKNKIIDPEVVIDLMSISDRSPITETKDYVSICALTSVAEMAKSPIIHRHFAGLHKAALSLATPQLRNVGTVGGNLCQRPRCWYYRDPEVVCRKKGGSICYAFRGRNRYHSIFGGGVCHIVFPSDLAPALISLDAVVTISGPGGEKTIPLGDFYTLPQKNILKENVLEENQFLKEIRIPAPKNGSKSTYYKFKERGTWDFAMVSCAVNGIISGGSFQDIKIVLGGVAPIPWRLKKAEDFIKGKQLNETVIRQGAKEALKDARPLEENAYKLELVEAVLIEAVSSLM